MGGGAEFFYLSIEVVPDDQPIHLSSDTVAGLSLAVCTHLPFGERFHLPFGFFLAKEKMACWGGKRGCGFSLQSPAGLNGILIRDGEIHFIVFDLHEVP